MSTSIQKKDSEADASQMVIEEDDHDESESLEVVQPVEQPKEDEAIAEAVATQPTTTGGENTETANAPADTEVSLEDFIKKEKRSLADRIQKAKAKVIVVEGKNFNERVNVDFEDDALELRPEVLHVYGVDFLSTSDITKYFSAFGPVKIEWLNDSSCNAVFPSEELAEKASEDLALTIQDANLSDEWKKGIPYKERNIEFSLFFRLATTKDVKGATVSGKESQYYKYMNQKLANQRAQKKNERNDRYNNNYNNNDNYNNNRGNRRNDNEYSRDRNSRSDRYSNNNNNNNKNSSRRNSNRYESPVRRDRGGGRDRDRRNDNKESNSRRDDRKRNSQRSESVERKEREENRQKEKKQNKKSSNRAWSSSDSEDRSDRRNRGRGRRSPSNSSSLSRSRSRSHQKTTIAAGEEVDKSENNNQQNEHENVQQGNEEV